MRGCLRAPPCFGGGGGAAAGERGQSSRGDDTSSASDSPCLNRNDSRRRSQKEHTILLQQKYVELEKHNMIGLEADLYTFAFVSSLAPPRADAGSVSSIVEEIVELLVAVFAMFLVPIIQLLMGYAVYLHVENNLIHMHSYPLYTAYEMFVGSNITVPLHTVEALCGFWEDQEMKDFSQGPLRTMTMPDGTVYGPDERYSLFYNLKQPTRTWDYGRLGEERSVLDDVMFVISEGLTLNPFTPSGYSLLFIMTIFMFFFSLGREFRMISRWFTVLAHLDVKDIKRRLQLRQLRSAASHVVKTVKFKKSAPPPEPPPAPDEAESGSPLDLAEIWQIDSKTGRFRIRGITFLGRIVGYTALVCRSIVLFVLALLGTLFLVFTTLKIDLILNGLALIFMLELGTLVYHASVPGKRQKFIENIEPISFVAEDKVSSLPTTDAQKLSARFILHHTLETILPSLMIPINFVGAMFLRRYQVWVFKGYFRMTAAICLFAGPTIPFADKTMVSPVAGFCDSLLGVSCAPSVIPEESRKKHGYCVITDQTTMSFPSIQLYLDDPKVFSNRYNPDGSTKSWVEWGEASPELYTSQRWMKGPYQDMLRKQCLQMYQKEIPPDDVMVDDDSGETMDGAPFMCAMEPLFSAVFGDVRHSMFHNHTGQEMEKVESMFGRAFTKFAGALGAALVKDLTDPDVVAAIDACKHSKVWSPEQKKRDERLAKQASKNELSLASFAQGGSLPESKAGTDKEALAEKRRLPEPRRLRRGGPHPARVPALLSRHQFDETGRA